MFPEGEKSTNLQALAYLSSFVLCSSLIKWSQVNLYKQSWDTGYNLSNYSREIYYHSFKWKRKKKKKSRSELFSCFWKMSKKHSPKTLNVTSLSSFCSQYKRIGMYYTTWNVITVSLYLWRFQDRDFGSTVIET